jgi:hypothetical protein
MRYREFMDSTRFINVLQVFSICFLAVIAVSVVVITKPVEGADKFTIDSKTSVQNTNGPIKFKVIASANGETIAKKTSSISDPNIGTIDIPFQFNKVNDIVSVGFHDEYFVCGYILDAKTTLMTSYVCNEGDLQSPDVTNAASLSSFLTVPDGKDSRAKDVKISVLVPYYDKLDGQKIKVVAMIKGEFQSKIIDEDRTKANMIDPEGTNGKRIGVMFTFDRNTDIGKIQLGEEFFACVSANALNPPSGTACEKRHVKTFDEPNFLAAGHIR